MNYGRSLSQAGLDATRAKWEGHWANAVSDSDFDWLVNAAHCTSIRLPIGYFTLGPSFCDNTPFAGQPAQVYANAWQAVKTFVSRCRGRGIGVLLDLHAVPGGANGDIHSGTSSGRAELWGNQANLALAQRCLVYLAQEVRGGLDGVVGIQLCNEAVTGAPGMYQWYDSVIGAIAQVDASIPIYISDAWDLNTALNYSDGKNRTTNTTTWNPTVVDTHKYYTFSDADKAQSPQQIIGRIPNELNELNGKEGDVFTHGAAQLIVGEYSDVLDGQTWSRVSAADKPGLVQQFGRAQSQRWQQKAAGSYFWTYKMDWMDGGEWGFAEQTKNANILPPQSLLLSADDVRARANTAQAQRQQRKDAAVASHTNYWNSTAPGATFEHWRFGAGWDVGFSDALAFFTMKVNGGLQGGGADKIGCLDLWVRKREAESGQGGQFVWEWEQGFRQGVGDLGALVGV